MTDPSNPYAAPEAHVEDVLADPNEPASRFQRLRAAVVDTFIVGIAAAFAGIAFGNLGALGGGAIAAVIWIALIGWNLVLLHRHGQTIGKRVANIRIVRVDGTPASLARIVLMRAGPVLAVSAASGALPFLNILVLIDTLFIFGPPRRCIHDYIADTIVVKTAPAS